MQRALLNATIERLDRAETLTIDRSLRGRSADVQCVKGEYLRRIASETRVKDLRQIFRPGTEIGVVTIADEEAKCRGTLPATSEPWSTPTVAKGGSRSNGLTTSMGMRSSGSILMGTAPVACRFTPVKGRPTSWNCDMTASGFARPDPGPNTPDRRGNRDLLSFH